jgi:solute:Na+ symporter, SSS family
MIAVVKDVLIYITVFAAIIAVPIHLGGYDKVFSAIPAPKLLLAHPGAGTYGTFSAYATLALGSAFALFLYPHSITGVLSSSSARVVRRNAAMLPAYSLMLGLLALVGFMAIAIGVQNMPEFAHGFSLYKANFAVPALFMALFPSWFVGVAFAAIAIGALVPAAIMSIATANTFTRNIYREFLHPACTDAQESQVAKIASLVVKAGALVFIFALPLQYAIWLQLLGGVWIIQTAPAVVLSLYTRFFNGWGLLLGWVAGFGLGTWMITANKFAPIYPLHFFGTTFPCYPAIASVVVNVLVAWVVSLYLNRVASDRKHDVTVAEDYA